MHDTTSQTTGVFTTDARLVVRTWDAWLARATGIPTSAAQGRALTDLIPDLAARGLLARFERVLADGNVSVLAPAFHKYLIRCAPLEPARHFDAMQQRANIGPLRDGTQIVGTIVTIEDVTARRDRERDLAADLASPNETTRLRAAQALAQEEAEAEPALVDVLYDSSWRVRQVAVEGLARQGTAETIPALIRAMHDDHQNPSVLNSALQVLAQTEHDALSPLVALLESPDADLRGYVTLALGERRDPHAIPALLAALDDADVNVRYHAIEALGKLRARDAATLLATIAASGDFFLAFPALDALAQIGDPSVAARIVHLLDDTLLASPTADLIGSLGDISSVVALAGALGAPTAPVPNIVQALAAIYDRSVDRAVVAQLASNAISDSGARNVLDALASTNVDDLRAMALVLGWLDGPAVRAALVQLLAEPTVRAEVVESVVRHGARIAELLIAQLATQDREIREAAIIALGRIGSVQAVPALIAMLADEADLVLAAGSLAKIGDRRAFEPLLELLGHSNAAVRQAVIGALNSLGHADMAARIGTYLDDPNPLVRESAVKIAGYFGYPACVEPLLARCHDQDERVRRAAIKHLPFLEDERVVPALAAALHSETPSIRAAAARALGQAAEPQAIALLLAALDDPDIWVRYYAVRALGHYAAPETTDALVRLAETDVATHVRVAAIEALGELDDEHTMTALLHFAALNNDELALPAMRALARTKRPAAINALCALLHAPQPTRRAAAIGALAPLRLPGVAEQLHAALNDPAAVVRIAGVMALRHLDDPVARSRLAEIAQRDPDVDVRAAARAARAQ